MLDTTKLGRTHCAGQRQLSLTSTVSSIKLLWHDRLLALFCIFLETKKHQNLSRLSALLEKEHQTKYFHVNRAMSSFPAFAGRSTVTACHYGASKAARGHTVSRYFPIRTTEKICFHMWTFLLFP